MLKKYRTDASDSHILPENKILPQGFSFGIFREEGIQSSGWSFQYLKIESKATSTVFESKKVQDLWNRQIMI